MENVMADNNENKFIAASVILSQIPGGRAIDDQTLMLEASEISKQSFDGRDATELYRRLSLIDGTYLIPIDDPRSRRTDEIHYMIWKRR